MDTMGLPMGKGIPILLLCLFFSAARAQDSCNRSAFHPIDIIRDPFFANAPAPCLSSFAPTYTWYRPTNEMETGFLYRCTDYTIPDSTFYNHSFTDPYVSFFPLVPQPVPNGGGVAAVSDFAYNGGINVYYAHKSYISTCLLSPLQKDSLYRLEFYAGFGGLTRHAPFPVHAQVLVPEYSATPEIFGLFGRPDCSGLASPAPLIGCPSIAGWVSIGSVKVEGDTGFWVKVSISFQAPQNIMAIALGPSCDTVYHASLEKSYMYGDRTIVANQYSYFLTGLRLYQSSAPAPVVSRLSGDSCGSTIVLQVQPANYYTGARFQWYRNDTALGGQNGITLSVARDRYTVAAFRCQIQNDSICLVSNPFPVRWLAVPNSNHLGAADTAVCSGDTVFLSAGSDPSFAYRWQDGSTLPYFRVTQSGSFTVSISNSCGVVRATKTVRFGKCDYGLYVPNGFTPNGDGHNDIFHVRYFSPPDRFELRVFNRFGQEVFATTDPAEGWDGRNGGIPQPTGAYLWMVGYRDKKGLEHVLRGTVVLVR